MNTRKFFGAAVSLAAALLAGIQTGCNGSASEINGRVVPGSAAIVQVVDDNDSRLTSQGIEGVEVEVKSLGRAGDSHLVGTATSDKDGQFSVPIADRNLIKNSMILTARRNGIPGVREPVQLPGTGRQVLVMLPSTAKAKGTQ